MTTITEMWTTHPHRLILLLFLSDREAYWAPSSVSRALDLPRSTTWSNLQRLVTAGWAETSDVDGRQRYRLTADGADCAWGVIEDYSDDPKLIEDARALGLSIEDILAVQEEDDESELTYEQLLARAIGKQLRQARKRLGMTRLDAVTAMDNAISTQTLATYELGTRAIPVYRLFQVCAAVYAHPDKILAEAQEALAWHSNGDETLCVDLGKLARCGDKTLAPVRAWARSLLQQHLEPSRTQPITLSSRALAELAVVCQQPVTAVSTALRDVAEVG